MAAVRNVGVGRTPVVEEEAATVAASRVAAPGAVTVAVTSSFAALPHRAKLLLLAQRRLGLFFVGARGREATLSYSCWQRPLGLGARGRDSLPGSLKAALNARFVVSEDALRLHVHAGSEAKTGIKVATLAEKLKKLNYSCPPAVPTARDAERPRIAAHAARPRIIAAHGPVYSRCGAAP